MDNKQDSEGSHGTYKSHPDYLSPEERTLYKVLI